jgi:hypothetical protein
MPIKVDHKVFPRCRAVQDGAGKELGQGIRSRVFSLPF